MVDAIVLSAGRASRFGVPKWLLPAGEGQVLLTRVLEQAAAVVDGRIAVVVGRASKVTRYVVERWVEAAGGRVHTALNRHYRYGQSTSLKAGIRALPDAAGVLVMLADMPALEPTRLERLRQAIQARGPYSVAVAASLQGQVLPPVYLSAQLFPDIQKLRGDQGARAILRAYEERVERVEWGAGPWFTDVDDWPTYRHLAHQQGWALERGGVLPRRPVAPAQFKDRVDAALASQEVPWLAPGILLLPSSGEACWLDLTPPYRGVRSLVMGRASTPEAYLQLLRSAALAALASGV
ncbi:NTP transferase domain-containing protein [Meiothermus ruber]|jgi:CTP:molybdopterin cytidylyltransferase MocA|uniref:MobA-like protein n=1 Tax=Meiothermus ruber (strain ATCC 35948 / DSM 1279 / VKM B-1258 / 21) TaxID=504728 RepID=D3PRR0_MEIRD|nr:nucleotidyltransferase family protein [Meiothermus ruber]ADD28143.1 Putative MobA-related protein [Meiothermus ruber DSM 1279]AGK04613.1 MobA-like protein [Meiothermus ruber DSM 1279]MCL6528854.1 nucleotidyltransferase family protein [Meiothermus ruber]GAO75094.1 MobA-like protein [Meiothermus ruber H328]